MNARVNKAYRNVILASVSTVAFMVLFVAACSPAKFDKVDSPQGAGLVPNSITPTPTPASGSPQDYIWTAPATPKKVDIILVDDNSTSMQTEQQNLATRFSTFIDTLNTNLGGQLDWQLGVITTDMSYDGPLGGGNLVELKGLSGQYVANRGTPNVTQVFQRTIQIENDSIVPNSGDLAGSMYNSPYYCKNSGGATPCFGSGDERGIYAALSAVKKNQNGWIRSDSNLAVIILSDEDERSSGGQDYGSSLEAGHDFPADLINTVSTQFGTQKKLTVHSIIIKPGDQSCFNSQKSQMTGGGTGSYGATYQQLSQLTGGVIGSVCASDYGSQLSQIGTQIQGNSTASLLLKCLPQNNDVTVNVVAPQGLAINPVVSGMTLSFNPALPEGTSIRLRYTCQ